MVKLRAVQIQPPPASSLLFLRRLHRWSSARALTLFLLVCFLQGGMAIASDPLPQAAAASSHCQELLLHLDAELGNVGFESPDPVFLGYAQERPSVRLLKIHKDRNGEELLEFERISDQWLSKSRTNPYDPQGDPRWFLETIGPEAAKSLGFELAGSKHLILPGPAAFQKNLERLSITMKSQGAEEGLSVSFYEQSSTKIRDYLDQFIHSGQLPISADRGNHFLHDMSFHSAYVFVPERIHNYTRDLIQYSLHLYELNFQRMDLGDHLRVALGKELELELVEYIDHTTASYSVAMNRFNRAQRFPHEQSPYQKYPELEFEKALRMSTGETVALSTGPEAFFKHRLEEALVKLRRRLKSQPDLYPTKKSDLHDTAILQMSLFRLPLETEGFTPQFSRDFRIYLSPQFDYSTLCARITKKRRAAQKAALAL